jgi:predicted dehydrogenase
MSTSHSNHLRAFESGDSRRAFLAKAAAIAGTSIFFGCETYSASGEPVPAAGTLTPLTKDEPIKMGVIGTGGMGTGHCDSILALVKKGQCNVQILALADVCQPRLEVAHKKCAAAQPNLTVDTYTDYKKLLARPDLHGVLIASPEHWHSQHAIDAILAGKDVYCEKPMTLNLPMALRLREVCLKNPQVIFQFGTQYVNYQRYIEARKVMEAGTIGKPVLSQTSYCRNSKDGEWLYPIDPNWKPGVNLDWDGWCGPLGKAPWDPEVYIRWRRYRKYSTGIVGDLLVHWMTPMMMALNAGWPTRVIANGGHYVDKKMENHDTVLLAVEFEKEHTMLVTGATNNATGLETMIRGHKGNIYLGNRHCVIRPESTFDKEVEPTTIECPEAPDPQDLHRLAWFNSIRTREQPRANIELGTMVMVVVDLATRGMWDGHAYSFDHKTMTATRL